MQRQINAKDGPEASGSYSQALEVSGGSRTLYISGQVPVDRDGSTPASFAEQARLAWANVGAQLTAAGMTFDNIVKHTTFLADRRYREENSEIRQQILGERAPALTVVIATIYDDKWLLEVEAIAVA